MNIALYRGIFFGLLITAVAILFTLWQSAKEEAKQNGIARDAANRNYESVAVKYINAQGDLVTKQKTIELNAENFKKALEANELKWVNKFHVKPKNIESANTFSLEFQEQLIKHDTVYITCKDSLKVMKYTYRDQWNDIQAMAIDTPKLDIRDRIYAIETRTRPKAWFWKLQWSRWKSNYEITNANKLITIDSVIFIKKQR